MSWLSRWPIYKGMKQNHTAMRGAKDDAAWSRKLSDCGCETAAVHTELRRSYHWVPDIPALARGGDYDFATGQGCFFRQPKNSVSRSMSPLRKSVLQPICTLIRPDLLDTENYLGNRYGRLELGIVAYKPSHNSGRSVPGPETRSVSRKIKARRLSSLYRTATGAEIDCDSHY